MRITGLIARTAMVATATAGLLLPSMSAAHADQVGAGAKPAVKCAGTNCVAATITTTIYPTGLGLDVVEFQCSVTASATAASTTLDSCSVGSASAPILPLSLPGDAVSEGWATTIASGTSVSVCVSGHAEFITGANPGGVGGCSNAILISIG